MKPNLLLLCFVLVFANACTVTRVKTPHWEMTRTSFLQKVGIPSLAVATNGTVELRGYKNDGGTEAAAAITAAAVSAALKAAP